MSVRTLGMNIVFQIIIFLYLLDNSETTSWMVLLSTGVGLLIEAWKVKKALNATVSFIILFNQHLVRTPRGLDSL